MSKEAWDQLTMGNLSIQSRESLVEKENNLALEEKNLVEEQVLSQENLAVEEEKLVKNEANQ